MGSKKIIIAGGGTGGHIFPAIAIANAIRGIDEETEILFVGAKGRMEMEKIPEAGYRIEGLDISGFNRSSLIKNIGLPFKLIRSFLQVNRILRRFQPDGVIGVGGYSSFPVLRAAQAKGIPTFIHESNSFAGRSNIMLGKKATRIFTGSTGMEKFFPAQKILVSGNPVRKEIIRSSATREEGVSFFSLSPERKTVLVVGGSLGARSINEAIDKGLERLTQAGLQLIWQTGKPFAERGKERAGGMSAVWVGPFISRMDLAYAAADLVVARAGAMTVAELCVVRKPVLFVPYPFAAEDHQTVNARKLVDEGAARMIADNEAAKGLVDGLIQLAAEEATQENMKQQLGKMAITNADDLIAKEIMSLI